ncbi:MAG TPA: FAD:protein FMN transferase [Anaerolineales bacterium]|nr:FAD:protein FMN transferase [Anaerolineales bacterium]
MADRVNRRGFLKIMAFAGLATGLGIAARRRFEAVTVRASRALMGTVVNFAVTGSDRAQAEAGLAAALGEMERLIALFDHRRAESALGRLNAVGELLNPASDLVEVLRHAVELSARTRGEAREQLRGLGARTRGAFDVSVKPVLDAYQAGIADVSGLRGLVDYRQIGVSEGAIRLNRPGMALTLDGLAKGRVVDGAVDALRDHGFAHVFVEAGGDLRASSADRGSNPWQVGIQAPRADAGSLAHRFSVIDGSVATSGDYLNAFTADRSLHHVLDPRTLRSPEALASATTLASTAMAADALSTALLVLGPTKGLALVQDLPGVEALLITKDGQRLFSSGFPTA